LIGLYGLLAGFRFLGFMNRRFFGGFAFLLLGCAQVWGQEPEGYYDGAAGLSGATLKTALSHIIRGHTKFSYDYL
jgi:hypothetical protein